MEQKEKRLSKEILDTVVFEVVEKDGSPYKRLMKEADDIDVDYFEDIERDGETLSPELNLELKDKVVGRFVGLADGLLGDDGFERDVLRKVGTLTAGWQAEYGAELTGKAVRRAKDDLAKYAEERLRFIPEPKCSLAELGGMYDDAKERTLVERIMRNNKDDVISFHHALMDRTVWECKEAIERRTSDLLLRIAGRI